jgi:UDPglucose 6-dehydrogenase
VNVAVIGTGYVGLVSGVCLAEYGHQVICVDMDAAKIDQINQGHTPIYEKGLEALLKKNIGGNLSATTDLAAAVQKSDISLIAVGTPFNGEEIDLGFIKTVSRQIGTVLAQIKHYHVVVVKSTVVPGTTDGVVLPILEEASAKKAGSDFGVGMNPEFLREGEAVDDFFYPDRIVIGTIDEKGKEVLAELYAPFKKVDKLFTNTRTAEMIKYTGNSLLATMISFSNEIANLCSSVGGIDVTEVMQGVHLDKRLSPILPEGERISPIFTTYLEAGCGFGGSCFPKDVKALIAHGKTYDNPMQLLDAVIKVNQLQPNQVMARLKKHFPVLKDVHVAVLGLAFKPGTDDMRESPAIPIIEQLMAEKAKIKAFDPVAMASARKLFKNDQIQYCQTVLDAVEKVDAILLLTRWEEFAALPDFINKVDNPPLLVDGRRMLAKDKIARYEGIGL